MLALNTKENPDDACDSSQIRKRISVHKCFIQTDWRGKVVLLINGVQTNCLIDAGATFNHIDLEFYQLAKLDYKENNKILKLKLAVKNSTVETKELRSASVEFQRQNLKLLLSESLL